MELPLTVDVSSRSGELYERDNKGVTTVLSEACGKCSFLAFQREATIPEDIGGNRLPHTEALGNSE